MVLLFDDVPEQEGDLTFFFPQNSSVEPQNPNLEQQTFKGHSLLEAH